jgi:hypothetical protein
VPSGYGYHLVALRAREDERTAALSEQRDLVVRDWVQSRRTEANARFYADLRERYVVTVARPASGASAGVATGPGP